MPGYIDQKVKEAVNALLHNPNYEALIEKSHQAKLELEKVKTTVGNNHKNAPNALSLRAKLNYERFTNKHIMSPQEQEDYKATLGQVGQFRFVIVTPEEKASLAKEKNNFLNALEVKQVFATTYLNELKDAGGRPKLSENEAKIALKLLDTTETRNEILNQPKHPTDLPKPPATAPSTTPSVTH